MKAQLLVDAARALVGTPFRHQGRNEFGLDCIGLVILARLKCGKWDAPRKHDDATYRRNPQKRLADTIPLIAIKIEKPEVGALALIQWPKMAHPNHVGIVTPETIIHAYAEVKQVVETGYREPWDRMTVSLYRLPGFEQ